MIAERKLEGYTLADRGGWSAQRVFFSSAALRESTALLPEDPAVGPDHEDPSPIC